MCLKRQLASYIKLLHSSLKKYIYAYKKKQAIKKLQHIASEPYRLHLGCGLTRFEDWVNIDRFNIDGVTDVEWDLQHGIPAHDSSCKFVYSEHLLEHLSVNEGLALLGECYRALEPGGVVRIAMPSLDALIEMSYKGNWRDQEWLSTPEFGFVQTRAEMLNISFRWWEHQWLYDREELNRRLHEVGFSAININNCEWGNSHYPELRNRETRHDSMLICEAVK